MFISRNVTIIHTKRKTLAVQIDRKGRVIVRAPLRCPSEMIDRFLREHSDWIQNHLQKFQGKSSTEKNYTAGETFFYLGIPHILTFGSYSALKFTANKLEFPQVSAFRAQKELTVWYKAEAKRIISSHVDQLAQQMQTHYGTLTFSDTISKWGSCSPENNLQLNWRLIMAPMMVINYVVIHELAHTLQHNHSQAFWKIVATHNPSYKQQIKWLKTNSHLLQF